MPLFFPAQLNAQQEIGMRRTAILLVVCALAISAAAQQPAAAATADNAVKVTHLIGLGKVPRNAKGTLTIEGDKLHFNGTGPNGASELALGTIQNVQTADDSKRLVGGVVGTLSMFGPYGSGRFLSLFRTQIDVLTIEYRDANGGLHGAIFTMADNQAQPLKDKLVAAGAEAKALPPMPAPSVAEDKKPEVKK